MPQSFEDLFPDLFAMMTEIIRRPDDDKLRLDYAEAWDDVGFLDSDRSLLIRLQLASKHQDAHELMLRKSLFPARFTGHYPKFVRGFVEQISISPDEPFQTLHSFFTTSPIRHLNIHHGDLRGVFHRLSAFAPQIISLLISDGTDDMIRELITLQSRFSNLQWLSIDRGTVSDQGVAMLVESSLPLRHVNLSGNPGNDLFDVSYYDYDVVCHVSVPDRQNTLPIIPKWLKADRANIVRYQNSVL